MQAVTGFVCGGASAVGRTRRDAGAGVCRHDGRVVRRLVDPSGRKIPLNPAQVAPEGYKPVEGHPGTFPPGTAGDNYPLEDILHVADGMNYQVLDMDSVTTDIFEQDKDLLEHLGDIGLLVARNEEDEELDDDIKKQMSGITEEDLDYSDNDEEEVLTYFSRTGLDSSMVNPLTPDGYSYEDMY